MNKRFGKEFDENVQPRPGLMEALQLQLAKGDFRGKTIHLCFMCDPYPAPPVDTMITRQCIQVLKEHGCHVQILTKGGARAERDFDLLDSEDWFGVTLCGYPAGTMFSQQESEPFAAPEIERLASLSIAHKQGIKTWMSIEPVLNATAVLAFLELDVDYIDKFMIGKLNYAQSDFDLVEFGRQAEAICIEQGRDYYIKASLRAIMEANNG